MNGLPATSPPTWTARLSADASAGTANRLATATAASHVILRIVPPLIEPRSSPGNLHLASCECQLPRPEIGGCERDHEQRHGGAGREHRRRRGVVQVEPRDR